MVIRSDDNDLLPAEWQTDKHGGPSRRILQPLIASTPKKDAKR
jgi:hypothetical protein